MEFSLPAGVVPHHTVVNPAMYDSFHPHISPSVSTVCPDALGLPVHTIGQVRGFPYVFKLPPSWSLLEASEMNSRRLVRA